MTTRRSSDGSAGDSDYTPVDRYSDFRRADARIAAMINGELGDARTVLNVGAGSGNYEPRDRAVTAVEPSATMRAQRPVALPEAVDAVAESLPFADDAFDASMATFSVHQWADIASGLAEMRRVTAGPVVILTCDPQRVRDFWLNDYCPRVLNEESRRYPTIETLRRGLGGAVEVSPVPIPQDCTDGFNEAYFGRPEMLLDPAARLACSAWGFVPADEQAAFEVALRADLESGAWDRRHGALRDAPDFRGALVVVTATE